MVRSIADPNYTSLFDGINLGIHEIGHFVFAGFGHFLHALGGTILQCAAPIAAGVVFWRQQDYFALAFAGTWLGTNLHGVAIYMADARARILPLVSPVSAEPQHDWEYLFGRLGLLHRDTLIAGCVRMMAITALVASVAWGAWVLWCLLQRPKPHGAR